MIKNYEMWMKSLKSSAKINAAALFKTFTVCCLFRIFRLTYIIFQYEYLFRLIIQLANFQAIHKPNPDPTVVKTWEGFDMAVCSIDSAIFDVKSQLLSRGQMGQKILWILDLTLLTIKVITKLGDLIGWTIRKCKR